jgi:hypothetical protein
MVAIDVASPFCLHYAGKAAGPARPFGFSMRKFAKEAESLPITSPEHVTALTQVLDYFASMEAAVSEDHVVLGFSAGPQCTKGDAQLIDQVCLHMGYPRDVAVGMYLTGENSDLATEFPELPCLRDVVYLAKLLLVPVLEGLPEVRRWRPAQAKLTWKWEPKEGVFFVTAFGGRRLDPSVGKDMEKGGKSFWASLFRSECSLKLTECSLKLTESSLNLNERSLKLTECSLGMAGPGRSRGAHRAARRRAHSRGRRWRLRTTFCTSSACRSLKVCCCRRIVSCCCAT